MLGSLSQLGAGLRRRRSVKCPSLIMDQSLGYKRGPLESRLGNIVDNTARVPDQNAPSMPSSMIEPARSVVVAVDDGEFHCIMHHILEDISIARQTVVQVIRRAGKGQIRYNEFDIALS